MSKCTWFGHKWAKWVEQPQDYKKFKSSFLDQRRVCKRCGKIQKKIS